MKISQINNTPIFNPKVIIPALVIVLAAAGAFAMVKTAPKSKKRAPQVIAPLVETMELKPTSHPVWVSVMGTVTAARQITLESRVSGEINSVSNAFVPGGYFNEGDTILTLDGEDYQLALNEVQSEVATAKYNLEVEQGYQNVAGREWNMLKNTTAANKNALLKDEDAKLALRKPHLQKAEASLKAAQAKLTQALLNLERTTITAPFAAMIETKSTDVGATVTAQESLATLIGTDEFWIQASVPVDRLDWITFPSTNAQNPQKGSTVRIITAAGNERTGKVVRLMPSLESEGRMAQVLISVKDPLNLQGMQGRKPLLLGSYVTVKIDGGNLDDVYSIPRTAYRENSNLWIVNEQNQVEIRSVSPVWKDAETVIISKGLAPSERIITSPLDTPMEGMNVRIKTQDVKNG